MIAHAVDTPPAIVRGYPGRPFRDFYFAVKLTKSGHFAGWFKIPCNGKCHTIHMNGTAVVSVVTRAGTVVVPPKKAP